MTIYRCIACLVANQAPFHFHRVFRDLVGDTPGEYVRRMRLQKAAFELVYDEGSVASVAFSNGYDSPSAFARAFKGQLGVPPTAFRQTGLRFWEASYPSDAGTDDAEVKSPTLVFQGPRRLLFVRRSGPDMMHATEHSAEALIRGLEDVPASLKPQEFIGITPDYDAITPSDAMRYDACIPYDDRLRLPAEIAARNMPGGLYALFVYRGNVNNKQAVNDLWRWIYRRWAPDSGLRLRSTGAFERFPSYVGPLDRGSGEVQLFVPLKTCEARKSKSCKEIALVLSYLAIRTRASGETIYESAKCFCSTRNPARAGFRCGHRAADRERQAVR